MTIYAGHPDINWNIDGSEYWVAFRGNAYCVNRPVVWRGRLPSTSAINRWLRSKQGNVILFFIRFLLVISTVFAMPGRTLAEPSSLELSVQRERGHLLGGTLFEVPGETPGAPELSIGIQNVVQTGMPSYSELLTIHIRNDGRTVWRDLGKPFERGNFVWLVALNDQLIAIDRQDVAPPQTLITGDRPRWRPLTVAERERLERYLQRQRSALRRPRAQSGPFSIQVLQAGTLEICRRSPPSERACRRHSIPRNNDIVYAVASAENSTVLFANSAWFRIASDGTLSTVRVQADDPERSNQIYTALRSRYGVLLGHYPSGNVLRMVVSDKDLVMKALSPDTPYTAPAHRGDREVQSLAYYAGRLVAGVWPWGELYELHAKSGWVLVRRLFAAPDISQELAPYANAISPPSRPTLTSRFLNRLYSMVPGWADSRPKKNQAGTPLPDVDVWGQRITQLVPLGKHLYLATGNKSGEHNPEWRKFLPSPALASEYGRVYELTSPGNLACNLPEQGGPLSLEFSTVRERLEVRVGDQLLCVLDDRTVALSAESLRKPRILGDGMYGKFIGGHVSVAPKTEVQKKETSEAGLPELPKSRRSGSSLGSGSSVHLARHADAHHVGRSIPRDTYDNTIPQRAGVIK